MNARWNAIVAISLSTTVVIALFFAFTRSAYNGPPGCSTSGKAALIAGSEYLTRKVPTLRAGDHFDANCDSGDRASVDLRHPSYAHMRDFLVTQSCSSLTGEVEYSSVACDFSGSTFEIDFKNQAGKFEGELYLSSTA